MHFILISKKENFKNEYINEDLLKTPFAPSLISRESLKIEISNFIIFIYPYDDIQPENFDYSYYADEEKVLICNGLVNANQKLRDKNICKFFEKIDGSVDLLGDYQLISINKKGNGFFKTPPLSIKQLFFYEDDNCSVLSTEIKLIVDGINSFKNKKFVDHFDIDFIEDSIFREWAVRKFPRNTIFKEIKRVFPNDLKCFNDGKIIIKQKDTIDIPQKLRAEYNSDKKQFYDKYYKNLLQFVESNLENINYSIDKITLGLTGGFDSRLTVALLSKICNKQNIELECFTHGDENHPDVVIAKKIAEVLNLNYFHYPPPINNPPNTKTYSDYLSTFYISQGDFNSKDFVSEYNRQLFSLDSIFQLGMDAFKRHNMDKIYSANRWFARRILFNKNYFFPLFFTKYETWLALLYGEQDEESFKEFIYEILKRNDPELLNIPFAGESLPQTNIEPYLTKNDSTFHEKDPFLWDYDYVRINLKPLLEKRYNKQGTKARIILKILGLNELDFFINKNINKTIQEYHKNKISLNACLKKLYGERYSRKYPRSKSMLRITKEKNYYTNKLQILMDFASAANQKSFQEIEKNIALSEN